MSTIAITQNPENIEEAIQQALGALEIDELIRAKYVAIKPNETYATEDDRAGVTQGDTLRAVVNEVKKHHPQRLVITGGAGAGETDDVFKLSGVMDVIKQEGIEFIDHNRPPFKPVKLEYAPGKDVKGPQNAVMVNPNVLEYECLIAVNQLKLHKTATVTMGLKNIAMSFPAADFYGHPRGKHEREHCFFDDMHSFIASMFKRFPIDLSITVGHPAMVGTGPLGGYTAETGLVIAGTDALAVDVVGARMLGFDVQAVRYLWEAKRLNLGETNVDEMEFPKMSLAEAVRNFTRLMYGKELTFEG